MKIYTLTLNPAYDVHANAEEFSVCHENFASITSRDAGGKGVNISRALQAVGVANTPIVVIGKENGEEFKKDLLQFGLDAVYFEKDGRIRENQTIHHDGEETRISFSGFSVDDSLLAEVSAHICAGPDTYVTFTGSIPNGVSKEAAKAFLIALKEKGVKIVLDCRSFDLQDVCQLSPWLVKPNQQEVSVWFDLLVETMEQAGLCAQKLFDLGVENAMVSMGSLGAVLACGELYAVDAPCVAPVSTIGAGDSSLAGFLYATAEGKGKAECLRYAVAFGSAACLTDGTQPPQRTAVARLYDKITMIGG